MKAEDPSNPYAGNLLTECLPGIQSSDATLNSLLYLPPEPTDLGSTPKHVRLHDLMSVRDLHVPTLVERRLFHSIDLMVRQGYSYRDPRQASTWASVSGDATRAGIRIPQATAAAVEGLSGVGKTQACLRCLHAFGPQVIRHERFPKVIGGLTQVLWLSVEAPPSGRSSDLARALMLAWDEATGGRRFDNWLAKERIPDGMRALDEWRQVAVSGFLGILHLDEIQNLFKISSLKQRVNRAGTAERPEISIVEDRVVRWFLNLVNTGQIPVLVSGTPDGIGALTSRLSTLQRLNTAGYHRFEQFSDHTAPRFRSQFLDVLARYQYVQKKLSIDDNLAKLIIDLTSGIQRVIIALWIAAHRVAFERADDSLRLEDFITAAQTWLEPLAPAVAAIREGSPSKMAMYEDLVLRDTPFWSEFWSRFS
jgi:hypothetical protein